MTNTDWDKVFSEFDWDTYFAKLDANPQGNIHHGCDHAYGYCAATPNNAYNPKGA